MSDFIDSLHSFKKRFAGSIDLAKIPLIANLRKKIIELNRKRIADNVNGYTMYLDDIDSLALSWHMVFEPGTTEFFKKNIKPGQTVVDLGANIGYYTLLFSGLVGENGHVYAFEPDPESLQLLRKNIEVNSIKNVTVIDKAVDNTEKTLDLFINKENRGNHQIFNSGNGWDAVTVKTTSMDHYFGQQRIDWIKIDIEGAEYRALQGMKNVIQNNPKLILVSEIYAAGLKSAGTSVEEYIHALSEHGFTFEEIDEKNNKIAAVTTDQVIQNSKKPRRFFPNIICRQFS